MGILPYFIFNDIYSDVSSTWKYLQFNFYQDVPQLTTQKRTLLIALVKK